ncbi:T9SS type A sorting domain-containing protein [bacterium]|nr:T9SS type A sorting domain-containing protein [bacterium]
MKTFKILLTLLSIFLLVVTGYSQLYENFEQYQDFWPWENWQISPTPPSAPNRHTWGVEDSSVYFPGAPGEYRSIWCSGLPNDLIPGEDDYRIDPNEPAWAIWGPFSLDDVGEAYGSFKLWMDVETGDDGLKVVCTNHPEYNTQHSTLEDLDNWCVLYEIFHPTAQLQWEDVFWDFTEVDSAGETISYLGREDIYFAIVFIDDGDEIRGGGAFIDNLSIGWDVNQVRSDISTTAHDFEVVAAYPNPFNSTVSIKVQSPIDSDVAVSWYDITGRLVGTQNFVMSAGIKTVRWQPESLSAGIYYARINSSGNERVIKAIYLP